MDFSSLISRQLNIPARQTAATLTLLDEKATIPFIARYRKEKTGGLNEVQIAEINDWYNRLKDIADRKQTILNTIEGQGKLTEQLKERIASTWDNNELEDLYLPYKPHKKTRADIAREKGLEPLANDILLQQSGSLKASDEQLQGARDIIAEVVSLDERVRQAVRREFTYTAAMTTKPVKGKADTPEAQQYRDYFSLNEPLHSIPAHRLLAIRRAEKEGFISTTIAADEQKSIDKIRRIYIKSNNTRSEQVGIAIEDSYKRLIRSSIANEFAASSKQKADEESIRVFASNLKQLLLDAPLGQKRILALDPGYRTGCKLAILNENGDLLAHDVVYIRMKDSADKIVKYVKDYRIEAIAIGNGTASRECEEFVRLTLGDQQEPAVFVVSENGASVYSASDIGRQEFPDEDVTVRGAVSIGRRLMDPLAELVKIDPKSIGVGQYQHDVDQTMLKNALQQTVESVVNYVGVDVNTASPYLLTYISGVGPALAQQIVKYRGENGSFHSRQELKKVPKLGAKTFEQASGFLRITNSANPLDNSAVHPERYELVERMAKDFHCSIEDLMTRSDLRRQIDLDKYISDEVGMPTLLDIMHELEKPSRDPREQRQVFHFDENVHTIDDLKVGMELPGIITNIASFGAFVDIGVHKDGLIHISQMSNRRISNPNEVVRLHEQVRVKITDIDIPRQRITLTMKL